MDNEKIKQIVSQEKQHFIEKITAGFDPVSAFESMLGRIIKESNQDLIEALKKIKNLNPEKDSNESCEWGEADCFAKAQEIAQEALSSKTKKKSLKR